MIVITVMEAVLGIGMCICSGLWGAPLKSGIFHCTGSSGISYSSCVHHHDHPSDRSEGRFCLILFCRWWHWMMWLVWWSTVRLFLLRWQLFPGLVVSRWKYLKTDPDQWGSTGVRRYFWLAVKMHDAKRENTKTTADHIGGSAVCFLRDLFSGRCIPSSGMYVHGNHLY